LYVETWKYISLEVGGQASEVRGLAPLSAGPVLNYKIVYLKKRVEI